MTPNWDMRTGSGANTHEAVTGTADSHMAPGWQQKITLSPEERLQYPSKTLESTLRSLLQEDVCVTVGKSFLHLKSVWKMTTVVLGYCWDLTGIKCPETGERWTWEPEQIKVYPKQNQLEEKSKQKVKAPCLELQWNTAMALCTYTCTMHKSNAGLFPFCNSNVFAATMGKGCKARLRERSDP